MRMVCRPYAAFSEQVSAVCNTDIAKVRSLAIARGRVWSGLDAFQPGLVHTCGQSWRLLGCHHHPQIAGQTSPGTVCLCI